MEEPQTFVITRAQLQLVQRVATFAPGLKALLASGSVKIEPLMEGSIRSRSLLSLLPAVRENAEAVRASGEWVVVQDADILLSPGGLYVSGDRLASFVGMCSREHRDLMRQCGGLLPHLLSCDDDCNARGECQATEAIHRADKLLSAAMTARPDEALLVIFEQIHGTRDRWASNELWVGGRRFGPGRRLLFLPDGVMAARLLSGKHLRKSKHSALIDHLASLYCVGTWRRGTEKVHFRHPPLNGLCDCMRPVASEPAIGSTLTNWLERIPETERSGFIVSLELNTAETLLPDFEGSDGKWWWGTDAVERAANESSPIKHDEDEDDELDEDRDPRVLAARLKKVNGYIYYPSTLVRVAQMRRWRPGARLLFESFLSNQSLRSRKTRKPRPGEGRASKSAPNYQTRHIPELGRNYILAGGQPQNGMSIRAWLEGAGYLLHKEQLKAEHLKRIVDDMQSLRTDIGVEYLLDEVLMDDSSMAGLKRLAASKKEWTKKTLLPLLPEEYLQRLAIIAAPRRKGRPPATPAFASGELRHWLGEVPQVRLARRLGVHHTQVGQWVRGERSVPAAHAHALRELMQEPAKTILADCAKA